MNFIVSASKKLGEESDDPKCEKKYFKTFASRSLTSIGIITLVTWTINPGFFIKSALITSLAVWTLSGCEDSISKSLTVNPKLLLVKKNMFGDMITLPSHKTI